MTITHTPETIARMKSNHLGSFFLHDTANAAFHETPAPIDPNRCQEKNACGYQCTLEFGHAGACIADLNEYDQKTQDELERLGEYDEQP